MTDELEYLNEFAPPKVEIKILKTNIPTWGSRETFKIHTYRTERRDYKSMTLYRKPKARATEYVLKLGYFIQYAIPKLETQHLFYHTSQPENLK